MNKLYILLVLSVMFLSGCMSAKRIVNNNIEVMDNEDLIEHYINSITNIDELKEFCKINDFYYPPKDPFKHLVIDVREFWAWQKYDQLKEIERIDRIKLVERYKK